MLESPLLERWGHSCTVYDGRVFVWGGRVSSTRDTNDMLIFEPSTGEVVYLQTRGKAPTPRRRHSALQVGRSMLVFGGYCGAYLNDFHYISLPKQEHCKAPELVLCSQGSLEQKLRSWEKEVKSGVRCQIRKSGVVKHTLNVSESAVSRS